MAFGWSDDLLTGHPVIDAQHRELVGAIERFRESCGAGKGRDGAEAALKFMLDYTARHFHDEEMLQIKFRYPDQANHKQLHEGFKKVVAGLGEELRRDGPTIMLFNKVNTNVGGWLVKHVIGEDKKVAAHIRAAGE
jgi:hemerythrin